MHLDRFRIRPGDDRALDRIDPDETGPFRDKDAALKHLKSGKVRLEERQEQLVANDRYSLLLVFQGMDGAGKDSAIKHVLSGVNPQGTEVHSFRQPSAEELAHDFLWRAVKALPARGRIGIFNRSYYEDVVTVRVHPALVEARRLPAAVVTPHIWKERFEDINAFERHLARSGTVVRKFYLHLSRKKQAERLLERLDEPSKHWKFNPGDLVERGRWQQYLAAWGAAIAATSHAHAPWYVVPSDHKWFAHTLIAEVIVDALKALDLSLPPIPANVERQMAQARRELMRRRR
ncbi:MAG TPA: PPK2 family polyphosphate kinase [Vicinamibacterales bacterium]|nr:PPK2 family polyphosphate kinase [Vicinamibacterales bacterium]